MKVEQRKPNRSIRELCSLLGYSTQAYYKFHRTKEKRYLSNDLLLNQVARLRINQKKIGARKMLGILQPFMEEHNIHLGRDAFFDLLKDNGLLVRKRKRRKPITTFSNHPFKKYQNLIKGFEPTAPNQLWVSDITYIHLQNDFAYLSLITDAYSRKIVGFCLHHDLSAKGTIKALQMALKSIPKRTKLDSRLVHHSDRGLQYGCNDYVELLNDNHISISMTQTGDPLENAIAERVNGILKDELLEEVHTDFETAQYNVAVAISTYNHLRPHSSIEMLTPVAAHQLNRPLKRTWKNYYKRKENIMV
ncbi:MAG: IS3 family transposase [Bacteroidia bacterium]|nr:IS3 family transposase [Bacteroidia bacterium]